MADINDDNLFMLNQSGEITLTKFTYAIKR